MKSIWLRTYNSTVPATIDPDKYSSLNDMFAKVFAEFKERPAFTNLGKVLTFADIEQQSRYFAAFLRNKLGVEKGDRFAIMMPNILQFPIALIGILRAGAIVVNVNTTFKPGEFSRQMRDSQSVGVIVAENFAHIVDKGIENTAIKHIIVAKFSDFMPQPKAIIVDLMVKYIKRVVPKWDFEKYYDYKDVIAQGSKLSFEEVTVSNSDIAFLAYTGGTTGIPKGAKLTHRNIVANLMQNATWANFLIEPGKEISFNALPMSIHAITTYVLTMFSTGSLIILVTNPLDIKTIVKELKKYKCTVFAAVDRYYNFLLNQPEFCKQDFSKLKFSISAGTSVQQAIFLRWKQVTKVSLNEAWGMTECMFITSNPLNLKKFNGTVGLPMSSTEVSVRNEEGDELGIDHPGELWVRGPQVMAGYWQQEAETRQSLTPDGWFKTGDVGKIDENGFVTIIDRKKDIINISGFAVYPSEVEIVIAIMPEIKEVAVVDAHDHIDGEYIKAFVVSKDPNLTEAKVLDFCKQNLPYYKVPKVVEFRQELPKNMLGKVLRRSLRD